MGDRWASALAMRSIFTGINRFDDIRMDGHRDPASS